MFEFRYKVENVRRGAKSTFNAISRSTFDNVGQWMHRNLPAKRFTEAHARTAGYTPRSPNYVRQKIRKLGRQSGAALDARADASGGLYRPLEFSGKAKRNSRFSRIRATASRVQITYAGLRVFNLRSTGQKVNMLTEYLKLLDRERAQIVRRYDTLLKRQLDAMDLNYIFKNRSSIRG